MVFSKYIFTTICSIQTKTAKYKTKNNLTKEQLVSVTKKWQGKIKNLWIYLIIVILIDKFYCTKHDLLFPLPINEWTYLLLCNQGDWLIFSFWSSFNPVWDVSFDISHAFVGRNNAFLVSTDNFICSICIFQHALMIRH